MRLLAIFLRQLGTPPIGCYNSPMNEDALLHALLTAPDTETLERLLAAHKPSLPVVQALKDISARHYFSNPAEGVRIAELAKAMGDQLSEPAPALGTWALASALIFVYQYADAVALFAKAHASYTAQGENVGAARVATGYAIALAFTGKLDEALRLASDAEPILAAAGTSAPADQQRHGNLLMNMGIIYELLGQYEEALQVYEQQALIAKRLDDRLMLGQLRHNVACALVRLNAVDEALAAFAEAEGFLQESDAATDLVRLYANRATLLATQKRWREAQRAVEAARQRLAALEGVDVQRHWVEITAAQIVLDSGTTPDDELLVALQTAQKTFAIHGPTDLEGLVWLTLGHSYRQRQLWHDAKTAFTAATAIGQKTTDRALAYRAAHGLGLVAQAQGDQHTALQAYQAAIEGVESVRKELAVETFRADFLTDKLVIYQDLAALLLAMGKETEAFAIVERSKARLVGEKLAFRLTLEASRLDLVDPQFSRLTQTLREALETLDLFYNQAQFEEFQSSGEVPGSVEPETRKAIATLETRIEATVRQIQRHRPTFGQIAGNTITSLAQLSNRLETEYFLQYHLLHDQVALFVSNHDGLVAHLQLGPLAAIEEARKRFGLAVERLLLLVTRFGAARAAQMLTTLQHDAEQQLQRLHELLLVPVLPLLPPTAPLLIAPITALHYVPFHALHDGETYLVEQRAVSYTPSGTVLDYCTQVTAEEGQSLLVMGYDDKRLANINHEIATLATLFPSAQSYVGETATTSAFFEQAPTAKIIHLAAHAIFRADNPMLSAVTLADRSLALAEIASLQLDTDLAVLSGCETGHGQLRGSDLLSLAGGFLGAGARSLLVSLWRVEDLATAQLMTHFYQAMLAGQPRAQALQHAQLALLNQGRGSAGPEQLFAHPAYWAPFLLMGEWRGLAL